MDERSIDLRPEGYCSLTGVELDDHVRTLFTARNMFIMLVSARGLDDETTQKAWARLSNLITEMITLAPRD